MVDHECVELVFHWLIARRGIGVSLGGQRPAELAFRWVIRAPRNWRSLGDSRPAELTFLWFIRAVCPWVTSAAELTRVHRLQRRPSEGLKKNLVSPFVFVTPSTGVSDGLEKNKKTKWDRHLSHFVFLFFWNLG